MNNNAIITLIVVVLIIVGGYLIYQYYADPVASPAASESAGDTETGGATSTGQVSGSNTAGTGTSAAVKEFTVTAKSFSFTPNTITVNKGDKVRITLKNDQGMHDLKIDDFNVATKVIPAGQSDTVEFTADSAGTYSFYCSVGNHRAMGMEGVFTVRSN